MATRFILLTLIDYERLTNVQRFYKRDILWGHPTDNICIHRNVEDSESQMSEIQFFRIRHLMKTNGNICAEHIIWILKFDDCSLNVINLLKC